MSIFSKKLDFKDSEYFSALQLKDACGCMTLKKSGWEFIVS